MKKKILISVNSLKRGGGAQKQAAELGSNLERKGHEVTFLIIKNIKPKYNHQGHLLSYDPFKNYRYTLPLKIILRAREIAKICSKKEIDTVISFMFCQNLSAILSKVIFGNKANVYVSIRNNPLRRNSKFEIFLMKKLYRKANGVVSQTNRVKKILNNKFSINNTTTVPNMIDLEKVKKLEIQNIKKEHQILFKNNFIFITVGSLKVEKGQWSLLRCFKSITEEFESVKLIVLGDGDLKDKLIKMTENMNIKEKAHFLGIVENVYPYLKESDCFILSSLSEGFPNVILEALSQDLPVISTDCASGPREILCPKIDIERNLNYPYLGEYGVLTKLFKNKIFFETIKEKPLSQEEKMFTNMMRQIYEDKKLRRKYSNGIKRAKDFEKEKIVKKWENLIV